MNIIGSIIIGLIVGVIAKLLHPGKDPGGWIISILIGLGGSFLAGWLGRMMGWYNDGETAGFIFSVVGAVLLLVITAWSATRKSDAITKSAGVDSTAKIKSAAFSRMAASGLGGRCWMVASSPSLFPFAMLLQDSILSP